VLVLHSYHHGFTWSDNISEGIRSVFEEQAEDVELRFEFMDTRRVYTEEYFQELKKLFEVKYAGTPIDVVIASDDQAYSFMMGLGQAVFPNIPVVFCSVSGYEPSLREDRQVAGLVESIDIKATLDLALQLHPDTKEVAVITDMTRTGRALRTKADKVFAAYESALEFTYLEDLTIEELGQKVSGLSDKTVVFLFIFSRDKAGRVFSHEHNLRILAKHCNVPIYAVWEFYLGHGIVGGMLTSGNMEGRMAAELALRVLGGEDVSEIPLLKSPTQYMFDYRQLERFGIKERLLPEDRTVINKPFSFYEEYRHLTWSVVLAFLVLALVVAALVGHILFRRRAAMALRGSEERYRLLVEKINDVVYAADNKGFMTYISPVVEGLLGYHPSEVTGKSYLEFVHDDDRDRVERQFQKVMEGMWEPIEYRLKAKSGDIRWVRTSSQRIVEGGRPIGLRGVLRDVTERRKAQEAVAASEARFRSLVETAASVILWLSPDGRILEFNAEAERVYGRKREEVIGQYYLEHFIPESNREVVAADMRKVLAGQETRGFENRIKAGDGTERTFSWNLSRLLGSQEETLGVIAVGLDVTESKKREAQLIRAGDEWRRTFDTVPELIMILDKSHRILRANKSMANSLGLTPEALVGKTCHEVVHGSRMPPDFCPHVSVLSDGRDHSAEVQEPRLGGDFVISVSPLKDEAGVVIGSVHVAHDITERKRAETALRESEQRYRSVYETAPLAFVVWDQECRVTAWNDRAETMFGWSQEEVLGRNFFGFLIPDSARPRVQDVVERLLHDDIESDVMNENLTKDGRIILCRWNNAVLRDSEGEIIGAVSLGLDITEHHRAEEALQESEARYRQLVQHAPSAIYEVDFKKDRFVSFNEVVPAYTGYSERELMKMNPLDLFTDYSKEIFRERMERMVQDKEVPDSQEYEIRKKDGTTMWALINASYEMEGGMPVRGRMVAHDITERKRMESVLKESEEKYRTLFDSAGDVIILTDSRGNLLDVNQTFEEESGYAREEVIGKNVFASGLMTEAASERALAAFKELFHGKEWQHFEITGVTKDGNRIPYEIKAVPVKKNGQVRGVQAILRNIRDRKEAEEALRTEKEKFEILVEESPLAVSLIGKKGEYKYINPEFEKMFGYTLDDIPNGRGWFAKAYPDPEYRDEVISAWVADIKKSQTGEARPRIFDVTCKDGSVKVIHFRPVTMQSGDQLVIYEDITEQRRLEIRLRQAQKMEAIGTLAGGIAHDFNNMLTPIIMQTEMAMRLLPKESPVQHNLEEVSRAGHRAKDLVKQILTFGRQSERKRLPLKVTPVVKETMKLLRSSLPTTIEMRESISVASDVAVIDPTEIHQVLMNLCTNAAHAMRRKGGVLEVKLADEEIGPEESDQYPGLKTGSYLRLTVSDTGEGMDPATMDRIFDPFFTTKNRDEGTGMGLAVVHGIVKGYGGGVIAKSEPGKGTVFHVLIPKADGAVGTPRKLAGLIPTGNERILLVDDEESVLTTVGMMLEHLGYDVTAEKDGIDALETFQQEPARFDLVITDQTMPKMTGTDLARSLIGTRADLPIILFTGHGNGVTKEEAKAMGIWDYVMKPLVMEDMARTVRKVLDRAARHKNVV
jgi:PAS domain S-box-containing protein